MRLKEFQQKLKADRISAALLSSSSDRPSHNFRYFSGFEGSAFLIITPTKAALLVHDMEYLAARSCSRIRDIKRSSDLITDLKKLLARKKIVGIDMEYTSVNSLSRLKKLLKVSFKDISKVCTDLRYEKTKQEIAILKKACKFTDEIFHKTFMNFHKFGSEADITAFMSNEANLLGLGLAFPPIAASGSNAAMPHHNPTTKPLKKGFCVIDFGITYKGMCSDMTRTIYIGKPSDKDIELYHVLFSVQQKSLAICSKDRSFYDIDQYTKKMLGKKAKLMCHSVGHGVGFQPHEPPFVRKDPKTSHNLTENCVFTIEPGIYIPNKLGIRIEDTVLMTKKGCVPLTKTGKNLLVIRKKK